MQNPFFHPLARAGVAALALSCAAAAHAKDTVTIALGIPLTVASGGVYGLGKDLGYFDEENIEVKTIVFQGAGALLPQVASKKVTIGLPLPEPVLASHETGKTPLPVRYFYNTIPSNELELAVLADGPIKTIADLRGKKIGVGALTWGTIPSTRALLREEGLTPGKDVDIVAVGVLGSGFLALKEGRVDALNYNSTWTALLELTGTKVHRLPYPPIFQKINSNGFVTHEDTLRDNPDLLVRFGRAYTKAVIACDANPALCAETFWKYQPEARPKDTDPKKALDEAVVLVKKRMNSTLRTPDGSARVAGEFDLPVIREFVKAMNAAGEFNTADIPVERIFDNSLVQQYSRFDAQAVRKQAQAQAVK